METGLVIKVAADDLAPEMTVFRVLQAWEALEKFYLRA